jgi:hypothetical protein
MRWLFNGFMMWGAVLGWIIVASTTRLIDTASHRGPGVVHYGDGERAPERSEIVSESTYKRHNYAMSGVMLGLGLYLWVVVARAAKKRPTADKRDDIA